MRELMFMMMIIWLLIAAACFSYFGNTEEPKITSIDIANELCIKKGFKSAVNLIVDGNKIKFLCEGDL